MSPRVVKLLHVEDDELQQAVLARHLGAIPELKFTITFAESEDAAVEAFTGHGIEFVVMDYHLAQGNGLGCLRRLRQLDPIVPIVAVSGVATPEIAAELIQAGADDYISKKDLTSESLSRSVRAALFRAEALRPRIHGERNQKWSEVEAAFRRVCDGFLAVVGDRLNAQLNDFESMAREAKLAPVQVEMLFETACAGQIASVADARRLLRPVLLEALVRLFGDLPPPPGGSAA